MSSLFRQSLEYVPEAQTTMLSAQRQINSAVVPYVMGDVEDWRALSFLLNADTAELTQSLLIPRDLTVEQIDVLIDFMVRRGNRPFNELNFLGSTFLAIEQRIEERGLDVIIQAYEYKINCYDSRELGISLPDFATDVEIENGELLNIPSRLVRLEAFGTVVFDTAVLETLQHLVELAIIYPSNDFIFKGLPQYLEELSLRQEGIIIFEEGHHYDCSYLKVLKAPNVSMFPKDFIDSIGNLVELQLRNYLTTDPPLDPILKKFTKLEKLSVIAIEEFDLSMVPPWLKELVVHEDYKAPDPTKPLIGLQKLEIAFAQELTSVLKACPNLEELNLFYPKKQDGEDEEDYLRTKLRASFPQIKKLKILGWLPERLETSMFKLAELKDFFPNLATYEGPGNEKLLQEQVNFITKELSAKIGFDQYELNTNLEYSSLDIKKFNFDCSRITNGKLPRVLIVELPLITESLSFIVKNDTYTYSINDVIKIPLTERHQLYDSIKFKVEVGRTGIYANIELQAKPVYFKLLDTTR